MNYGLGFRFIPFKHVAIRLELRNYLRQNPPVWEYGTGGGDKCYGGLCPQQQKKIFAKLTGLTLASSSLKRVLF